MEHAVNTGLIDIERVRTLGKKGCKKVNQYNLQGEFIKTWESAIEIEQTTGYFASNITACCRGKYKTAYNYKWIYI